MKSKGKKIPKRLAAILSKAVKAYGIDDILASYIEDKLGDHGDTLAQFIVCEAEDVFDPKESDDENAKAVIFALQKAIVELQDVIKAILPPQQAELGRAFAKAADKHHGQDGGLEFDDEPMVSLSDDDRKFKKFQGAYVQCRQYVPMEELTEEDRKRFKKLLHRD